MHTNPVFNSNVFCITYDKKSQGMEKTLLGITKN